MRANQETKTIIVGASISQQGMSESALDAILQGSFPASDPPWRTQFVMFLLRTRSADKICIDGWRGGNSFLRSQRRAENSPMAFYDSINRSNLINHIAKRIKK
jgi:hypothetical protein